MNVTVAAFDADTTLGAEMLAMGARARSAQAELRLLNGEQKQHALLAIADAVLAAKPAILAANSADEAAGQRKGLAPSFLDRLKLSEAGFQGVIDSVRAIAALPDPVGKVLAHWTRPNGLTIERVATPIGVIGVIFESRPNVTADAGALCLAAGNAVILRAGSDALASARAIHGAMAQGLRQAGIDPHAIQLVPFPDRQAVGAMLAGLNGAIDVIVPRGGKSLVERVLREARVPVFAHLEGVCHVYVDRGADLAMARAIILNAKLRRPEVCGAAETLLLDRAVIDTHLQPLLDELIEAGCEIRGDETVCAHESRARPAQESDWFAEYLAPILAVRVVDGVDAAIAHIAHYGSNHTEAIITRDQAVAERFLNEVDSAIVLHNASTQFADGSEFGMGAEIGIATGRMHARGPVGIEQLTAFKYRVRGDGQIRP